MKWIAFICNSRSRNGSMMPHQWGQAKLVADVYDPLHEAQAHHCGCSKT